MYLCSKSIKECKIAGIIVMSQARLSSNHIPIPSPKTGPHPGPPLVRKATSVPKRAYKFRLAPGAHPLSAVKKLQGPVAINLLTPTPLLNSLLGRVGPDICLLDDVHGGRNKCESCNPDEGCFSLYTDDDLSFLRYIDQVAAETGLVTDLFLEYWAPLEHEPQIGIHNSALADTVMVTLGCRPRSVWRECPLPHVRVHMADVRRFYEAKSSDAPPRSPQEKYLGDTLYDVFVRHKGRGTFKRYCDRAFPEIPIAHIKELIYEYFDIETTAETIRDRFVSDPFFKRYSRIHHELAQLPPQVRHDIESYFIIPLQGAALRARHTYIQYGIIPTHGIIQRIEFCPMDFSSMMDVYAIARLLKVPGVGTMESSASQFGIFYMGATHCRNIAEQLVKMGYYENSGFYGEDLGLKAAYISSLRQQTGMSTEEIIRRLGELKCIRDIHF